MELVRVSLTAISNQNHSQASCFPTQAQQFFSFKKQKYLLAVSLFLDFILSFCWYTEPFFFFPHFLMSSGSEKLFVNHTSICFTGNICFNTFVLKKHFFFKQRY